MEPINYRTQFYLLQKKFGGILNFVLHYVMLLSVSSVIFSKYMKKLIVLFNQNHLIHAIETKVQGELTISFSFYSLTSIFT